MSKRSSNTNSIEKIKKIFPWANFDDSNHMNKNIEYLIIKNNDETENIFNIRYKLTMLLLNEAKLEPINCLALAYCIVKRSFGYKYNEDIEILMDTLLMDL